MVDLRGAGARLIWGLGPIKSGGRSGFGAARHRWISTGTAARLWAALSGFLVMLGLQSSTVTARITASFAGRGLLDGTRAQAVIHHQVSCCRLITSSRSQPLPPSAQRKSLFFRVGKDPAFKPTGQDVFIAYGPPTCCQAVHQPPYVLTGG
ncbi:hypothetical protein [Pseudorhodobacter sp.]|uniref:hypothetical protein n=1 Tax=Pseudorhodobacter sp. TaxID=1934400 RepID=UPI003A4C7722